MCCSKKFFNKLISTVTSKGRRFLFWNFFFEGRNLLLLNHSSNVLSCSLFWTQRAGRQNKHKNPGKIIKPWLYTKTQNKNLFFKRFVGISQKAVEDRESTRTFHLFCVNKGESPLATKYIPLRVEANCLSPGLYFSRDMLGTRTSGACTAHIFYCRASPSARHQHHSGVAGRSREIMAKKGRFFVVSRRDFESIEITIPHFCRLDCNVSLAKR